MQVRNSAIGKFVINSDPAPQVPSINQLSQLSFRYPTSKTSFSKPNVPEILADKHVVASPPPTEYKVQDYPLKRMKKGLSGWDWHTEASDEFDLTDRVHNLKPKYSTFQKLFPSRNQSLFPPKRSQLSVIESSPTPTKEFNIKHDRLSEYRECMLKAQQLFKIQ